MTKQLKFQADQVELILSQEKISTPRMFDDKNLMVGDELDLINTDTKEKFGSGKIVDIREVSFKEFVFDAVEVDEVYNLYRKYYQKQINPDDKIKWVDIEIIK